MRLKFSAVLRHPIKKKKRAFILPRRHLAEFQCVAHSVAGRVECSWGRLELLRAQRLDPHLRFRSVSLSRLSPQDRWISSVVVWKGQNADLFIGWPPSVTAVQIAYILSFRSGVHGIFITCLFIHLHSNVHHCTPTTAVKYKERSISFTLEMYLLWQLPSGYADIIWSSVAVYLYQIMNEGLEVILAQICFSQEYNNAFVNFNELKHRAQ